MHILISQSMHVGFIPSRCYNTFGGICMCISLLVSQCVGDFLRFQVSIFLEWLIFLRYAGVLF